MICLLGINAKNIKKRTNKYVIIHIYDRKITSNESVNDSFNVTLSNNDTQINFTDIIDVLGCFVPCEHNNIL